MTCAAAPPDTAPPPLPAAEHLAPPSLLRHLVACNSFRPGPEYLPLRIGGEGIGWLSPPVAAALRGRIRMADDAAVVAAEAGAAATRALGEIAEALAATGLCRLRGEAFDVRAAFDGPVLATADRGLLPALGIAAEGVHVNGILRRGGRLWLWLGVRARSKALAPGALDNLVAGGIAAGLDARTTLVKEAAEEAGIPLALAARARPVGRIEYAMVAEEGIRRDRLHCYDLDLPEDFTPTPQDGEVERFLLLPAEEVLAILRHGEGVKFNVTLVLIHLFLREGLIGPEDPEAALLSAHLGLG
jgi:thiamine pyrophosphokinase